MREALDTSAAEGTSERLKRCAIILLLATPQLVFWVFIPRQHAMVTVPFMFGSLIQKLHMLVTPFILSFQPISSLVPTILIMAVYATCRLLRLVTIDTVHLRMLVILIAISPLVPLRFLGVNYLDIRLPFITALLLIAVTKPMLLRNAQRHFLTAAVIGLTVVRLAIIFKTISGCASQMEELRIAMASVLTLRGAPILAIENDPTGACSGLPLAYTNVSTLAVIEGQSYAPQVFTIIPPVKAAARFGDIDLGVGAAFPSEMFFFDSTRREIPYLQNWERKFHYVLWLHFGRKDYPLPPSLIPLVEHSNFTIFEITLP